MLVENADLKAIIEIRNEEIDRLKIVAAGRTALESK